MLFSSPLIKEHSDEWQTPSFPSGVNIDVVMETVIVIQMHLFHVSLRTGEIRTAFPLKCQGNKIDTYRKCQQGCLAEDMEPDSPAEL